MTKSAMRGFAAGLWVAAIVMAYLFYTGQDPAETEAKSKTSAKQVQQYLESHNQVAVEKSAYDSLKAAAAEQQADKKKDAKTEDGGATPTTAEPKTEDESQKKNDEKSGGSDTEQKSEKTETAQSYTLQIEQGMTSQKVGSLLEDAGIIEDKAELLDYLQDHDLARKVQLGTFELTSDMSIAEIAKAITS